MNKHKDLPYLKHIRDAINDLQDSTKGISKKGFKDNKDIKEANIRRLEIIGEAVKNISQELKSKHPEIEWAKITATRNIMIHAYFNVDVDIVWGIIKDDIPKLKEEILKILKEYEIQEENKKKAKE